MKEIRVDEINNDIVIFAKDRARRPMDKVINEIIKIKTININLYLDTFIPSSNHIQSKKK